MASQLSKIQFSKSQSETQDVIKHIKLNLNIKISKKINHSLGYSIIPILITSLDTNNLYNIIKKYIKINNKYKSILEHIEYNIKNKHIKYASITIEDNSTIDSLINKTNKNFKKRTTRSNIRTNKLHKHINNTTVSIIPFTKLHQLFIVCINNKSFNKSKPYELLESLRVSGNTIFNIIKTNNINLFNLIDTIDTIDTFSINNVSSLYIETILEGLLLSSYKFNKYKTSQSLNNNDIKFYIHSINIVIKNMLQDKLHENIKIVGDRIFKLTNIVNSVFIARDLINEPANISKSITFINIIKQYIKKYKLNIKLEIFEKNKLEQLGMGLILGVGKGSSKENAPKILIMKYSGSKLTGSIKDTLNNRQPSYILLGKGITFDTGGLNLKSGHHMSEMKTDLSGASTVSSFLLGYAMNKGSQCIHVICPFAENSIGPDAIKPSDILTSYNGTTVEITNTDAEGRLILADCLSYIVDKYPKSIIIDFATLTGQQESLSSKMFSNILSVNSEIEVNKLIECGNTINELLVPLPLMEQHVNKLSSQIADIKNVSFISSADIIMSTLFMRQFMLHQ